MTTKADIINGAYARLRISGLTIDASPEEVSLALEQLEDTVRELDSKNICLNYNFVDDPDPNDEATVPSFAVGPLKDLLADRMAMYFGKMFDPKIAVRAMGILSSGTAKTNLVQYPNRMPLGSGNRRITRYRRYQQPQGEAPVLCSTVSATRESTLDYEYDISYFLELDDGTTETVSSYTLLPDSSNITIVSSSFTGSVLSYRATFNSATRDYETAVLKVTTSGGRIQNFRLDFRVSNNVQAVQ